MCKALRSGQFTDVEVYAIYRLANNLEEPSRSRTRSLIKKVLGFRNATVPCPNFPPGVPFQAHDDFKINIQKWLRHFVLDHREFAVTLHIPTQTVRETALPKIREWLHNHRKQERFMNCLEPSDCPCCCRFIDCFVLMFNHKLYPSMR